MDAYYKLGSFFDDVNMDSAVYYGEKGAATARELQLRLNEAEIIINMSWPLGKMGNYPRSLKLLNDALEIANDPSNEKFTWNLREHQTPQSYRLWLLGYVHFGFNSLYGYTGNYEKQIDEAFEAIKVLSSFKDSLQLALIYPDLGDAYFKLNKLDSAIYFQQLALLCYNATSVTDKKYSGEIYVHLGEIYRKKGDVDLAKENFEKAISVSEQQNNLGRKGDAHLQMADLYQSLKKTDSSLYHAKKALEAFSLLGKEKPKAVALRMISDYYFQIGSPDSSFTYLRSATLLNDGLDKIEKEKLREFQVAGFEETIKLQELEKEKIQTQNKIRTYAMLGGLTVFLVIGLILYRNNRQKHKANAKIERAYDNLKATQQQLIQSEKMASLGELTAGIAHEIQNPLNFVNNFSEVSRELIEELKSQKSKLKSEEQDEILNDIDTNLEKINYHGKRADAIVKGMLQHSRSSS
jgi:tetratricopeptide (TPR) repeat protein